MPKGMGKAGDQTKAPLYYLKGRGGGGHSETLLFLFILTLETIFATMRTCKWSFYCVI